ncbi:MAG: hypothetical protein NZO41_00925 [Candidatus Bipolaricaulota bacterium]|nr:hypothetical protein [Candidatus Bipolaricaulota bacterium]MDW8140910.1 SdrD B-like domain-containing protein [Candidatus Bipolaricaulota bacterium]
MKHVLRFLGLSGLALCLWASRSSAVPAGFQEFYLPLPAVDSRSIFVNIDNSPVPSTGMHYVVGVTASANNTKIYYDHWENGLLTGAAGDEVVTLNQGQFHAFESSNIPTSPRGTAIYYDGGDRMFIAGSLLQVTVSIWPESPGTVFTDAWEVYPIQAWQTPYVSPIGENLSGSYPDFTKVWMLVMSGTNGNSVQITDPGGPGLTTTLNRGQNAIYEVQGVGATVTATYPVQVHMMTGRFRSGTASEMRGYTLVPRPYWSNDYVAPVPSWSNPNANTNLLIYNPNPSTITINFEDKNGSGSFTVLAGQVRDYFTGAGRYVPVDSGARLQSSDTFWAIAMCDTGSATYDWGYALIPVNLLTTNNYISWAPGTSQAIPTDNGSPVYITALDNNTTVFIDYGPNDGVFDATYTLNKLDAIQVRDPDNDNSGMHIVSNKLIAIAWGESPNYAQAGTPYLDMGYTTLPLPPEWIDIALEVQKTATPEEVSIEEEVLFTIVISVPSTAGAPMTNVDLVDTLPPGWEYIPGSGTPSDPTSITGNLSSGYVLTWDLNWTINPGSSQVVTFKAKPTSSANTSAPNRNVAAAIGETLGTTLTADDDAFVTINRPDLTVNKTHTGDFIVGTNGTYTITVTNIGSGSTAGTVTVTDTLPTGLSFVSATGPGWTCSAVGQTVTCTHPGPFTPNASSTITLTVSVSQAAYPSVINTATVSTPNDSNPNNNSDDDPTNVLITDLAIEKIHTGNFTVGTTGVYTITVTNVSPEPTTGTITVTDTLPVGLGFVSGTGTGWSCSAIGQTVTCTNAGPLAPSASSTITLTVNVTLGAYPSVINSATVSTPGDSNPNNNSDDDPTEIELGQGQGQICGFKWLDLDADGNRAENEPYLPGITINLVGVDLGGNPVTLSTVTDENGQYCFTGLLPGTYLICEAPPAEVPFFETFPVNGPVCPNGTIGWLIDLDDGENVNLIKFGNLPDEPALLPLAVATIQALATPQGVYFRAIGHGVKEIAVELFDLSGRAIYRSDWQKNSFVWAYDNERSERVVQGVYLYLMSVKGHDGMVIKTGLRKLVVSPKPSIVDHLLAKAIPKVMVLAQREGVQFKFLGQGTREFSVQVFDLSGRSVYTSNWSRTSALWTLTNDQGQRVAKGIYLYVITVRGANGEVAKSKIQKLVVR